MCLFVCVALLIQHATHMRHIVICSLPGSTMFSTLSYKRHDFRGGGKKFFIEHKMCVLFSLQVLSQTVLILRINERDVIKTVYWFSCKVIVIFESFN